MTAGDADHWFDAGIGHLDRGRTDKAESAFRTALSLDAKHAKANVNLGMLLQRGGRSIEAEQCYRDALQADAGLAQAWFNLGTLSLDLGRLAGAAESFRHALVLDASRPLWHSALGWTLRQAGEAEAALEAFRRARELEPESQVFASDMLHALNFVPGLTAETIFAEHEAWARGRGPAAAHAMHDNILEPERKIRIGYLAPDFNDPSLASLIEPVLEHHARGAFGVLCYSDAEAETQDTWRIRKRADLWHATARMNNDQLADRIREDRVDILVDLAGHGARGKRVPLLERKPAPIQVSWMAYPCTTGLPSIDHRITDAHACPPANERLYSERVVRLPDLRWCFKPPLEAPVPLPGAENGPLTFGSFRELQALSRGTFDLWARVLRALPDSRMMIAAQGAPQLAASIESRFRERGVNPARIVLRDRDPAISALPLHLQVDICLDAAPCAGIATTFEALWMGVPVVALAGETETSKSAADILSVLGLQELVAHDDDGYERIAVSLAADRRRLAMLRSALRGRLESSPLTDGRRFAGNLEHLYREMWRKHCGTAAARQSSAPQVAFAPQSGMAPRVVVDGVFFQNYETGIARVWRTLLREWVNIGFAENIVLLDRDGTAPAVPGVRVRRVPRHSYERIEEDRAMLQAVCDEERATVFISTYYSTPLNTPVVMMVHDMIPELLNPGANDPVWREKDHCIGRAMHFVAVSRSTARDLLRIHPEISPDRVTVAHNGVDPMFGPADAVAVDDFRRRHGMSGPYFLLVGCRPTYKNAEIFFRAFARLPDRVRYFGVLCVGNAPILAPAVAAACDGSVVKVLRLSDEDLRLAYCGALALVYPSIYEGFGMPVIEALACGCPVITTSHSSLPEVAGDAAVYVHPLDDGGLAAALAQIQDPGLRAVLLARGLARAKLFSWTEMARSVAAVLSRVG